MATGELPPDTVAPWGIIRVKGQMCDQELPMQPITYYHDEECIGKARGWERSTSRKGMLNAFS